MLSACFHCAGDMTRSTYPLVIRRLLCALSRSCARSFKCMFTFSPAAQMVHVSLLVVGSFFGWLWSSVFIAISSTTSSRLNPRMHSSCFLLIFLFLFYFDSKRTPIREAFFRSSFICECFSMHSHRHPSCVLSGIFRSTSFVDICLQKEKGGHANHRVRSAISFQSVDAFSAQKVWWLQNVRSNTKDRRLLGPAVLLQKICSV